MPGALLTSAFVALLMAMAWSRPAELAQAQPGAPAKTIVDDITDPGERSLFLQMWNTAAPAPQRELAVRFVAAHPQSILLREAYEIAARASLAIGDGPGALDWGLRALRLLPEDVPLLVMVGDLAARQRQPALAERSARGAIRLLETAIPPPTLSSAQWTSARREWLATAQLILGRTALERGDHRRAEEALLAALGFSPADEEATYLLGVARVAARDDQGAAPPLAQVARSGGVLAESARTSLRAIHARLNSPAPAFDAYLASLRFVPPAPPTPPPAAAVLQQYAGSEACRGCHAREYDRWQATGMARMFRSYRPENVIGDFASGQTVSGNARAVLEGGRHFIEIRQPQGRNWTRYPVDYTIGSKWQQAYATRLPDQRLLVFPIQYSRRDATWLNYWQLVDAPDSARADITRFHEVPPEAVYQTTCAPCHTSQLAFPKSAALPAAATFREGGVNCEMCHGPARDHVEDMKRGRSRRGTALDPPVRFAGVTPAQSVAICAQCHAQSAVHDAAPTGEVNFSVRGGWTRSYPTHLLSSFPRTALYRDGRFRATTFISEAFARTQCFQAGGATCASCHDPHPADAATNPTSLKFGEDNDRMCVQCHTDVATAPEQHTRHAAGTPASRCVSCHMPRIAEALIFKARSHQIDDIPDAEMTTRFGAEASPNACLDCHREQGLEWLTTAMAARQR
jgi:predicted CXXCH cytochrome family protein